MSPTARLLGLRGPPGHLPGVRAQGGGGAGGTSGNEWGEGHMVMLKKKQEVNYRRGTTGRHCAVCDHFEAAF